MIISIPEFNKVILAAAAAGLDGVLPPKKDDDKGLTPQETLGAFLYAIGDLGSDKRLDQAEYRHYAKEASEKGIAEEDIKTFIFGKKVLDQK